MAETDLDAWAAVREELGESSPVLPFATGVILHLSRSGGLEGNEDIASRIIDVFRAIDGGDETAAEHLAESPVLVASFFQNLDLMPPTGRETYRVARLVAEAMEILVARER
jgi:hypothetical protein